MRRILVIDDDENSRWNLTTILGMEGFECASAPDGQAGIELAKRQPPDLVVCDVTMPGLDGYAVLKELRECDDTAGVPFIFLTAHGERQDLRRGMDHGADDYLCKPVSASALLSAIAARLRRAKENRSAARLGDTSAPDFSSPTPLEKLSLTPREAEVLLWVAQGKANGEIATILKLSEKTVKIHLGHILEKLGVENRTAAALRAIETLSRVSS